MTAPGGGSGEADRLRLERENAWRRYNEALTALDAAIQRLPAVPAPPSPYDESQLPILNERWTILPADPPAAGFGWRARASGFVWRIVAPWLQRQQAFNAALVEHLNRNVAAHRESQKVIEAGLTLLRKQLEALVSFESLLVQCLQQITPLVDTQVRVVEAGLADVEMTAGTAQRASVMAHRELERLAAQVDQTGVARGFSPARADAAAGRSFRSGVTYLGFEDAFRGSPEDIRSRLSEYLPYFEGASDVLDVGCGRGEFLEVLREKGASARGLDANHEMVEVCRARGLDVVEADALAYLNSLPDGGLGGLFAAQVVEHLEPDYLVRLLDTAFHKLRPGSRIVVETINPACWVAFFESYIRDITHVRPLHPETLKYLLAASGFGPVDLRFSAPVRDSAKLQGVPPVRIDPDLPASRPLAELAAAFNANVQRLNERLFTYLDYAAIGERR